MSNEKLKLSPPSKEQKPTLGLGMGGLSNIYGVAYDPLRDEQDSERVRAMLRGRGIIPPAL